MAKTPEGEIKKLITAVLREFEPKLWFTMPVPSGYGESTLDYLCCVKGQFFAIEAKAPGKKPTDRQKMMMAKMEAAGATTFVIDCMGDVVRLRDWIINVTYS